MEPTTRIDVARAMDQDRDPTTSREGDSDQKQDDGDLIVGVPVPIVIITPPERKEKMGGAIVRAIRSRVEIGVTIRGRERTLAPHRAWESADGTQHIEAYQEAGFSEWGEMGDPNFIPSRRGGYRGWVTIRVEQIDRLEIKRVRFVVRRDYVPGRRLRRRRGRLTASVEDPVPSRQFGALIIAVNLSELRRRLDDLSDRFQRLTQDIKGQGGSTDGRGEG